MEETEELFVLPEDKCLSGTSLFCKLYNSDSTLREYYHGDADKALIGFKAGDMPIDTKINYVRGVFDEYNSGNQKPFKLFSKKINLFGGKWYMFLDTETSGMSSYDKVIQLAYVLVWRIDNRSIEVYTFDEYIYWPRLKIHWAAKKVHGITEGRLTKYGLSADAVFKELDNMLILADYVVAYNAQFDKRMLIGSYNTCTDTVRYASWKCCLELVRSKKIGGSNKLGSVYKLYSGREIQNAHDALSDVRAMIYIWSHLNSW